MKKFLISASVLCATSGAASAHPGEHVLTVLQSVAHVLTEPDHLAMILGAVAIVGVLLYKRGRRAA